MILKSNGQNYEVLATATASDGTKLFKLYHNSLGETWWHEESEFVKPKATATELRKLAIAYGAAARDLVCNRCTKNELKLGKAWTALSEAIDTLE